MTGLVGSKLVDRLPAHVGGVDVENIINPKECRYLSDQRDELLTKRDPWNPCGGVDNDELIWLGTSRAEVRR